MEIDLNADLGEGAGFDSDLMPLITSANVCCGLHAGGWVEMEATFSLACQHGVVVGAHPGYPDRENFGRRDLGIAPEQLGGLCIYQIGAAIALGRANDAPIKYVKLHGALYNRACADSDTASWIAGACQEFQLPIVGLPHSQLHEWTLRCDLPFIPEGFADRRYLPDGSLVPRSEPDAFVHDPDEAVKQVEWLIHKKGIRTVCVHGDNPDAVRFTKAVREALLARGFTLKSFA